MTQRNWSTVEVSAYLDGQLEPTLQATLESDMAQDPTLHRRVEELRQIQDMVQGMGLRVPPRNYLLTPSMVAAPKTESKRRRTPLLMMRLATSLVAAAFVVTFGLTAVQRGLLPSMMAQTQDAPGEVALMRESVERAALPPTEAEAESFKSEPAQGIAATPAPEGTVPAQEESARAPLPEAEVEMPAEETAGVLGMGGAVEPEEEPVPEAGAALVPQPTTENAVEEPAVELMAEPVEVPEESATDDLVISEGYEPSDDAEASAEGRAGENADAVPDTIVETLSQRRPLVTTWLSVGLGVATLVMLAITLWMGRRRLD